MQAEIWWRELGCEQSWVSSAVDTPKLTGSNRQSPHLSPFLRGFQMENGFKTKVNLKEYIINSPPPRNYVGAPKP